ncbi:hypothetical protein KI387_043549, partial [Taxus chinensis]
MGIASDGDMNAKLYRLGRWLEFTPHDKSVLPNTLEEAESCLSLIEQSDYGSMSAAMDPLVTHLARSDLLRHDEVDVRLLVITCISEVTRITAPSLPYDDTTMEEIYELMIGSFQKLWDTTNPHFDKRVKILENMAKVRSCIPMLDLDCDDLIFHMFEVFFVVLHEDHSQNIMVAMQTIMSLMLNEYEDPPQPLLSILVEGLGQENQCIAHTLAKRVVDLCSSKVKTCIQGMSSFVFDDELLTSNDCMELSGCKEKSDFFEEHEKDIGNKHMHDEREMMAREHMKEKSDLREIVQPHRESFEGQEESMSLIKAPSHYPPSMNTCKEEKGLLGEAYDEEKSATPNSEILSFGEVGSSPRYNVSHLISPSMLSFDGYGYGHDRKMDMICNM